jgi:hypothetical protein
MHTGAWRAKFICSLVCRVSVEKSRVWCRCLTFEKTDCYNVQTKLFMEIDECVYCLPFRVSTVDTVGQFQFSAPA